MLIVIIILNRMYAGGMQTQHNAIASSSSANNAFLLCQLLVAWCWCWELRLPQWSDSIRSKCIPNGYDIWALEFHSNGMNHGYELLPRKWVVWCCCLFWPCWAIRNFMCQNQIGNDCRNYMHIADLIIWIYATCTDAHMLKLFIESNCRNSRLGKLN